MHLTRAWTNLPPVRVWIASTIPFLLFQLNRCLVQDILSFILYASIFLILQLYSVFYIYNKKENKLHIKPDGQLSAESVEASAEPHDQPLANLAITREELVGLTAV